MAILYFCKILHACNIDCKCDIVQALHFDQYLF